MNYPNLTVGDRVQRRHPWDGSEMAGRPVGSFLAITKVYSAETFTIYQLADGRSEFEFNVCAEHSDMQWEHEARPAVRLAS